MTITEIKELKEMGFTPDQIMSLSGGAARDPETAPAEAPAEDPAEDPAGDPAPDVPDPESQENQRLAQLEETVKAQNVELSNLRKLVQSGNRQSMRMEARPDGDLQKKTDEVMAELIRPTK